MNNYFTHNIKLENGMDVLSHEFENTYADFKDSLGSDTIVLSFAPANAPGSTYSITKLGWGMKHFSKFKVSIVAFKPKTNDWYRGNDLIALFRDSWFLKLLDSYKYIYFIGSSMGGYAAMTFSSVNYKSIVIAYAPQSTLNTQLVPWETRFKKEYLDWENDFHDAAEGIKNIQKAYIAYDPFCKLDKAHIDRLKQRNIVHLKIPFLDHAVAESLLSMGLLKELFEIIVIKRQHLSEKLFYVMAKKRRNIPWYYQVLSRQTQNINRKIKIYNIAQCLNPKDGEYDFILSKNYAELQNYTVSLEYIDKALMKEKKNARFLMQKANLLFEIGDKTKAVDLINYVIKLEPKNFNYQVRLANILTALNRTKEAWEVITKVTRHVENERYEEIKMKIAKKLHGLKKTKMIEDKYENIYTEFMKSYKNYEYFKLRKLLDALDYPYGDLSKDYAFIYENNKSIFALLIVLYSNDKLLKSFYYAALDTLYHTLTYKDLRAINQIDNIIADINSPQLKINFAHIKSLSFGTFIHLEKAIMEITRSNLDISFKYEIFNTYKRETFDFRRGILPPYLKKISKNLIESLNKTMRYQDSFRSEAHTLLQAEFLKFYNTKDLKISSESKRVVVLLEEMQIRPNSTVNKLILDWVYSIRKFKPDIEIEFLVTSDFKSKSYIIGQEYIEEVNLSTMLQDLDLLTKDTENLTLKYRNPSEKLFDWLSNNLNRLPLLSLLIFPSPQWPLPKLLRSFYPIVGVELANGVNLNDMVDIVIPAGIVNNSTRKKYKYKIYEAEIPQIPVQKIGSYDRKHFGLTEKHLVIISAGRNLLTRAKNKWKNYFENVLQILEEYPNSVWIFVGEETKSFTKNELVETYLNSNRIIIIEDEPNLLALYDICDIFAMPPIGGGGRGTSMAASLSLSCVCFTISDGAKYLPEQCVFKDNFSYFAFIKELIESKEKRIQIGNAWAYFHEAEVYALMGNTEKAKVLFDECKNKFKDNVEIIKIFKNRLEG